MATFPPPPSRSLDWSDGGNFQFGEANGHIESSYDEKTGSWAPLAFVSSPYLAVHGLATGLNYGQQVFEGLKAFRMPGEAGNIMLFRVDCHGKRFRHSAEVVDMPPIPSDLFRQACRAAVALNACFVPPHDTGWGLYLRPLLFAAGPTITPHLTKAWKFCIYVAPLPFGALDSMPPVKALVLDDFDRAAPRGTGHAKTGANYAGSFRWVKQAKSEGFGLTLHLDCIHHEDIEEFSTSGFLGMRRGKRQVDGAGTGISADSSGITLVVPDSLTVLPSLTSDSVQRIAGSLGWAVEHRRVPYEELPYFDEVVSAGTGTGLVPVRSISRRARAGAEPLLTPSMPSNAVARLRLGPDGTETIVYIEDEEQTYGGPLCRQLVAQLGGIQLGRLEDKFGWRSEVLAEDTSYPTSDR